MLSMGKDQNKKLESIETTAMVLTWNSNFEMTGGIKQVLQPAKPPASIRVPNFRYNISIKIGSIKLPPVKMSKISSQNSTEDMNSK